MITAVGITWVLKSDQGVGPFKITIKVRRVDVCANWFAKTCGYHRTGRKYRYGLGMLIFETVTLPLHIFGKSHPQG